MIVKAIFAFLCGVLYVIGIPFGWNYQETSVYVCIYTCPLICVFCALFTTYKAIRKKHKPFMVVNSVLSVLYILITWTIFHHYLALSVKDQFNDCMSRLYFLSDTIGISYEALNLLIYVVILSIIFLFHLIEVLIINDSYKKTRTRTYPNLEIDNGKELHTK